MKSYWVSGIIALVAASLQAQSLVEGTITQVTPTAVPSISWPTRPGGVYGLFRSSDPYGPFETQVGTNLTADGRSLSLADGSASGGGYYYRVEELAPGYARYLIVDLSGGSGAVTYPVTYTNVIPTLLTDASYKTNKIVLRVLAAGAFTMGTPVGELNRDASREYLHPVTFTQPFYIGVFEVTRGQYKSVMGGSYTNTTFPVGGVSYDNIRGSAAQGGGGWPTNSAAYSLSFVGRLRDKTGLAGLDLPTEAQWECACRAGTTATCHNGKDPASTTDWAAVDDIAWHAPHTDGTTVGSFRPNGWGLYDMSGNVAEWVLDWSAADLRSYTVDPAGPVSGSQRLTRGSAYSSGTVDFLRSGRRTSAFAPDYVYAPIGFRLARRLP